MPLQVLLLGAYFEPELTAIGPYAGQLARHLADRGHGVHVSTTFPHFPEWRFHTGYRRGLYRCESRGTVRVRRSRHILPRSPGSLGGRAAYELSFGVGAALTASLAGRVDVAVAIAPPLTSALALIAYARLRRVPLILWLQDLTTDLALALGALRRDSLRFRIAVDLERAIYGQMQAIVPISEAFRPHLRARGVPDEKIVVRPNWVDPDVIRPLDRPRRFRARHGFAETDRLVVHAGNLGVKQGLENALLAADRLREDAGVHLVLVGEGADKPALERRARELGVANVRFLPFQPAAELSDVLSSADLLLLTQKASIGDAAVPSKLLAYLSAGRPIIAAAHAESAAARMLARAAAGVLVPPDDPEALAAGIRAALADPAQLAALGKRGRAYVEGHHATNVALPRLAQVVEDVARRRGAPEAAGLVAMRL